jgi:hypothetical protein
MIKNRSLAKLDGLPIGDHPFPHGLAGERKAVLGGIHSRHEYRLAPDE